VRVIHDHQGLAVRLTDERLAHILDHPEMVGHEAALKETLAYPALFLQSGSDVSGAPQERGWGDKLVRAVKVIGLG